MSCLPNGPFITIGRNCGLRHGQVKTFPAFLAVAGMLHAHQITLFIVLEYTACPYFLVPFAFKRNLITVLANRIWEEITYPISCPSTSLQTILLIFIAKKRERNLTPSKRSECVPCGPEVPPHGRHPTHVHRAIHKMCHSRKLEAT